MAKTPRGKPRSVPDPAGDQYDEMILRERTRARDGETPARFGLPLDASQFAPFPSVLDAIDPTRRPSSTVRIGDRTYREVDNGRANVLIPADEPLTSLTQLAEQRRAASRVLFMANNPLGGAAYALATLMNAPPAVRDGALVAGGALDAATTGVAPFGGQLRAGVPAPKAVPVPPGHQRPPVRNYGANELEQAQGLNATVTQAMLGNGTKANRRVSPPGWQGNGTVHNEGRGHLLAKQLGGSGDTNEELFTIRQNPTNSSHMGTFENKIRRRVNAGEVMEYFVKPLYTEGILPPTWILMSAFGSRGAPIAKLVQNPAGRRR